MGMFTFRRIICGESACLDHSNCLSGQTTLALWLRQWTFLFDKTQQITQCEKHSQLKLPNTLIYQSPGWILHPEFPYRKQWWRNMCSRCQFISDNHYLSSISSIVWVTVNIWEKISHEINFPRKEPKYLKFSHEIGLSRKRAK